MSIDGCSVHVPSWNAGATGSTVRVGVQSPFMVTDAVVSFELKSAQSPCTLMLALVSVPAIPVCSAVLVVPNSIGADGPVTVEPAGVWPRMSTVTGEEKSLPIVQVTV